MIAVVFQMIGASLVGVSILLHGVESKVHHNDALRNFTIDNDGRVSAYVNHVSPIVAWDIQNERTVSQSSVRVVYEKMFVRPFVVCVHNTICLLEENYRQSSRCMLTYDMRNKRPIARFNGIDPTIWTNPCMSIGGEKLVGYSHMYGCPIVYDATPPGRIVLLCENKNGVFERISCSVLRADDSCATIMAHDEQRGIHLWRLNAQKWIKSFISVKAHNLLLSQDGRYCVTLIGEAGDGSTHAQLWDVPQAKVLNECVIMHDTRNGYSWLRKSWFAYDHHDKPHLVRVVQQHSRCASSGSFSVQTCELETGRIKTVYTDTMHDENVFHEHSPNGRYILLKRWSGWMRLERLRRETISVFSDQHALSLEGQPQEEWARSVVISGFKKRRLSHEREV